MLLLAGDYQNSGTAMAWDALRAGASGLDAMRLGIRAVESNVEDNSVGRGGYPNALGEVELDAGVMDGRTRRSGVVGGLRGFLHPVDVAYAVMERLPHVLLVGEGAARFADEIAAERGDLLIDPVRVADAARALHEWRRTEMRKNDRITLRGLYRSLELPGKNPLKDLHAALDKAVLAAGVGVREDALTLNPSPTHRAPRLAGREP